MRTLFFLAVAAIALSACAQSPDKSAPATTPNTVEYPSAPTPPSKPKITSAQLLGQGGSWVVTQLGAPAFVRTDRTANIWQYKNHACVLNVFLYADEDTKEAARDAALITTRARVLHFDARDTQGANTDRDTCLSALQN